MRKKSWISVSGRKYEGMLSRCYREKDVSYKNYGAVGIKVCKDWLIDIANFRNWLINHLEDCKIDLNDFIENSKFYQLDRINPNLHYEPDNCRITTPQGNMRNVRRRNKKTVIASDGTVIHI